MKKIIFCMFSIAFVSSLCFAQEPQVLVKPTVTQTAEPYVIIGKLKYLTIGATRTILDLVDGNGKEYMCVVKSTAIVYDADLKVIKLEDLKKDDKIKVKYTVSKEGNFEVTTINLLK
jgi:hypothetical protein